MRTRIYVSGPYSADPKKCTEKAIGVGQYLLDAGYAPMVPHLTHYWETRHFQNDYEKWLELDLAWVASADAVLRLHGESAGADREVELARSLGIPVFDTVAELEASVPTETSAGKLPLGIGLALDRIAAIFAKKGADYASDTDWRSNFRDVAEQIGLASDVQACDALIAVKQSRLKALHQNGRSPLNESTADTYLDRAVYGVIALAMLIEDGALG